MVERDHRIELVRMGKIDEFADGISETLSDLDGKFGNLSARAAVLKEKGADVAARWDQHFDGQSKAIAAAEAAINRISNVPLPSAASSQSSAEGKKDEPFRVVGSN